MFSDVPRYQYSLVGSGNTGKIRVYEGGWGLPVPECWSFASAVSVSGPLGRNLQLLVSAPNDSVQRCHTLRLNNSSSPLIRMPGGRSQSMFTSATEDFGSGPGQTIAILCGLLYLSDSQTNMDLLLLRISFPPLELSQALHSHRTLNTET